MQDTSPAARTPRDDEPVPGTAADGEPTATWYEEDDRSVDDPLIALIPLPDLP
jgi:hypothetical protein